jgi:hypothetical protein
MSELVGRFLSFEEHLGRGLVKFVYYVLLFLLVVSTVFGLVTAVIGMFSGPFWPNLWSFLVMVPLTFLVSLLLLRVGAELVLAILSIDDNLRLEGSDTDSMSTGLNPVTPPRAAPTMTAPISPAPMAESSSEPQAEQPAEPVAPKTSEKAPRKAPARKRAGKKATKKTAAKSSAPANDGNSGPADTRPADADPDKN